MFNDLKNLFIVMIILTVILMCTTITANTIYAQTTAVDQSKSETKKNTKSKTSSHDLVLKKVKKRSKHQDHKSFRKLKKLGTRIKNSIRLQKKRQDDLQVNAPLPVPPQTKSNHQSSQINHQSSKANHSSLSGDGKHSTKENRTVKNFIPVKHELNTDIQISPSIELPSLLPKYFRALLPEGLSHRILTWSIAWNQKTPNIHIQAKWEINTDKKSFMTAFQMNILRHQWLEVLKKRSFVKTGLSHSKRGQLIWSFETQEPKIHYFTMEWHWRPKKWSSAEQNQILSLLTTPVPWSPNAKLAFKPSKGVYLEIAQP